MAAPKAPVQKIGKLRAGYVVPPDAIRSGPKVVAAQKAHRAQAASGKPPRPAAPAKTVQRKASMSRTPTPPSYKPTAPPKPKAPRPPTDRGK